MNKKVMIFSAIAIVLIVIIFLIAGYTIAQINEEVRLRNAIIAKQTDNQSQYDNMWKKISQAAQVTDAQKKALTEIFTAHAKARDGENQNKGSIVNWIKESVPNVDTTTFNNLQNIIVGSRDSFTMRQRELLGLKQQHDTLLDSIPSRLIFSVIGKKKIDVTIVTSAKAKQTFKAGEDNDVSIPLRYKHVVLLCNNTDSFSYRSIFLARITENNLRRMVKGSLYRRGDNIGLPLLHGNEVHCRC